MTWSVSEASHGCIAVWPSSLILLHHSEFESSLCVHILSLLKLLSVTL